MLRKLERRFSFQATTLEQQLLQHKSHIGFGLLDILCHHSPAPRRLPEELQCWQMKPTPQLKVPGQEHPAEVEEYHNRRHQHGQLVVLIFSHLSRELVSRSVPHRTKHRVPLVDEVVCVRHTVLGIMMMIVIKIKTILGIMMIVTKTKTMLGRVGVKNDSDDAHRLRRTVHLCY